MTDQPFLVGYGRVDITPLESVPLRGYGNTSRRMSQNILDPLYATCLAMTDQSGTTLLLYALDLCVFGPISAARLRPNLSKATGIPQDRIMLSNSHTHSAPDLENTEVPSAARYLDQLDQWLLTAAALALDDRKPAQMEIADVQTEHLNFVRRYILEDGTYAGDNYGHFKLSPIAAHESPVDAQMQFIQFRRTGGRDILLTNFQGHPTRTGGVLKYDVSADAVGAMRREVEAQTNCLFAYFSGGSGNVNLRSRIEQENLYQNHLDLGHAMAQYALRAAGTFRPVRLGPIRTKARVLQCQANHTLDHLVADAQKVIDLYQQTYDRPAATALAKSLGFNSVYHAIFAEKKSHLPAAIPIELNAVSIGDAAFVFAPYEMFDTNAMEIKQASPFSSTFVLTCSNADYDYVPSALGFDHGGYSADSCHFLPGTGELLAQAFIDLLHDLRQLT